MSILSNRDNRMSIMKTKWTDVPVNPLLYRSEWSNDVRSFRIVHLQFDLILIEIYTFGRETHKYMLNKHLPCMVKSVKKCMNPLNVVSVVDTRNNSTMMTFHFHNEENALTFQSYLTKAIGFTHSE